MRKFVFLLCLTTFLPMFVSAQSFKVDLPEDYEGLYLYLSPAVNAMRSDWTIKPNEKVLVESVRYNGWCKVKYTDVNGKEFDGYLKMKRLAPLDEKAQEMKDEITRLETLETRTITWGIIILAIGFLLSFMKFLGRIKDILVVAAVILLSVVEIYFFTQTKGFTFYSPMVVGWKWALLWFLCFAGFIIQQVKLLLGVLGKISPTHMGDGILFTLLSIVFILAGMLIAIFLDFDEKYILYIFFAMQGVQIIYNFIKMPLKEAIPFNIMFVIGFAALGLMAYDLLIVAVLLLFMIPVLTGFANVFGSGKFGKVVDTKTAQLRRTGQLNRGETVTYFD